MKKKKKPVKIKKKAKKLVKNKKTRKTVSKNKKIKKSKVTLQKKRNKSKTEKSKKAVVKKPKKSVLSLKLQKILFHIFIIALIAAFDFIFFDFQISQAQENIQVSQIKPIVKGIEKNIEEALGSNPINQSISDLNQTDLTKAAFEKKIPILMYHYIENDNPKDSPLRRGLTVVPQKFEEQIKWLTDNGYQTLTLSNYFNRIAKNEEIPEKTVLITIDDGYQDFFQNAAPILARYNQTATVFIITNSIGSPGYLAWDEIKLLSDQGIEFGSHTLTHPNLTNLSDARLKQEIFDSKTKIEYELGIKINFFCYPTGLFDQRVEKVVKEAGYIGAVTTLSGYNVTEKNLFEIRRSRISHDIPIEKFQWLVENANK